MSTALPGGGPPPPTPPRTPHPSRRPGDPETVTGSLWENLRRGSGNSTKWGVLAIATLLVLAKAPEDLKWLGYGLALAPWIAVILGLRFQGHYVLVAIVALFIDLDKINLPENAFFEKVREFIGNWAEKAQSLARRTVLWTFALYSFFALAIAWLPTEKHYEAFFGSLVALLVGTVLIRAAAETAHASETGRGRTSKGFAIIGGLLVSFFFGTLAWLAFEKVVTHPRAESAVEWTKEHVLEKPFRPTKIVRARKATEAPKVFDRSEDVLMHLDQVGLDPDGNVRSAVAKGRGVTDRLFEDGRWQRDGSSVGGRWGTSTGIITDESGTRYQLAWHTDTSGKGGETIEPQFAFVEE